MKITTTGDIPDPLPPYDDTAIKAILKDHEARLIKLEAPVKKTLFDPNSWFYKKAQSLTILPNSAQLVQELNAQNRVNAPWCNVGTPLYFVNKSDLMAPVFLTDPYNAVSPVGQRLAQGINIPKKLVGSQTDSDKSCAIYNTETDEEIDIWKLTFNVSKNRYEGVSAGILPNASKSDGTFQRFSYWNTVRATHISIGAGHNLKKELEAGVFEHAGAIALGFPSSKFVPPAKTSDGDSTRIIPEGTRFRFPANITIDPNLTPLAKMLITQGRDYGFIVVDRTSRGLVHYFEGAEQYGLNGLDLLKPYLNGKELWAVMGTQTQDTEIPYSKLEAVA